MSTRIIDIAKEASVSPSAVSLALNNKTGVSAELRQRIISIAAEMGYRTNSPFPANETITIRLLKIARHGHIVNDRHNPFITEYLEGVEESAKRKRCNLEVAFYNKVPIDEIIEAERGCKINGFIVLGTELLNHELGFFTGMERPIVFIDTYFPLSVYDCIDMDNVDGVFKAVQHLYKAGHRSIGLVRSSYETRNFRMREFGFREAMEYFSLPVQEKCIISVDPAFDGSIRDMEKFLCRSHKLPTAFFCMNDIISYGVIKALRNKNCSVPGDVSIIGFDDLPSSNFSDPPLTTIRVSTQQIGRRAMEKLAELISSAGPMAGAAPSDRITENILISGKLVIRGSVRNI
jgi:LacI family transcriptional regulator